MANPIAHQIQPPKFPDALCANKNPKYWDYPGHHWATGVKICLQCPHRQECLNYAIKSEQKLPIICRANIWGATRPHDRHHLEKTGQHPHATTLTPTQISHTLKTGNMP
jgi:hypothetical protein